MFRSSYPLALAAYRYRHFVLSSVRAEFANRFARSIFGGLWMILNPLAQAAVIAFALSGLLSARLPGVTHPAGYALYLMAGILVWSAFQDTVTRCLTLFVENGALLKKLNFPRVCLPLVAVGVSGASSVLLMTVTLALFLFLGRIPGWEIFAVPVVLLITLLLAMGLGLLLGVMHVFVRDVGQVTPIALQFLFWLTPIVYLSESLPERVREVLTFSPLQILVTAMHSLLVYARTPDWLQLGCVAIVALLLLGTALLMFRRAAPEMVDLL